MGTFSIWHLLLVAVVAMLLFGSSRVSDMGKGLGEGIRNFKKGLKDDDDEPPRKKARVIDADAEGLDTDEAAPPKQLVAGATVRKKKVIQIEVDDDADEEEIARQIAKKRATTDEKAT